jgi:hypothetical protein
MSKRHHLSLLTSTSHPILLNKMDAEKAQLSKVEDLAGQGIPHPTSTPVQQSKWSARQKRFLLFTSVAIISFLTLSGYKPTANSHHEAQTDVSIDGYMTGIGASTFGGFKKHEHKHKEKHHKHKHGDKHHEHKHHDHHDHHGKHKHGGAPMTPKAAEDLFLSVPNNVSARA